MKLQYILMSFMLHLLILVLLVVRVSLPKDDRDTTDKETFSHVELLSEEDLERIRESIVDKDSDIVLGESISEDDDKVAMEFCRDRVTSRDYVGIGIVANAFLDIVTEAPRKFPAYKSGIREGDAIQSIKETANNNVVVAVLRDEKFMQFTVRQEKICFDAM